MAEAVRVTGLAEFSRNLRKLDAELPKTLRIALNEAADLVVTTAQPQIPKRTGRAQRSLHARSTRTAVRVSAGGNQAPYYPWLDFGGRVGPGRSIERPFRKEGRYLYAAYFAKRDSGEFADVLQRALQRVVAQSGLEMD